MKDIDISVPKIPIINKDIDDSGIGSTPDISEPSIQDDKSTSEKRGPKIPSINKVSIPVIRELEDVDGDESTEGTINENNIEVDSDDELLGVPNEDKGEVVKYTGSNDMRIPVTSDGKTIDEALFSMYSGNVPVNDLLIKGEISTVKKFETGVKSDKIQLEEDEGRKKASKRFIQKNSRYTEEEKLIMRNLGINPEQFKKAMKTSKLSKADKESLMTSGRVGPAKYFKGKRFRSTYSDEDIIAFLAKFKFANVKILNRLKKESASTTSRKLHRLKEKGLVADREVLGLGTIWFLTEAGMAFSGYDLKSYRERTPKLSTMPPTIGANNVAASLWNNQYNFLFLDDFPAMNKRIYTQEGGEEFRYGEELVSELEIRTSLGREATPGFGQGGSYVETAKTARREFSNWEKDGKVGTSPEMLPGNEYLWVLYPDNVLSVIYHVPDLVIKRDRDEDGSPNSIAVEIELNPKSYKRYLETMIAYDSYPHIFKEVIWVTNNNRIIKLLTQAAEEIGFEDYKIVPVMNQDGVYKNRDIFHV